MSSLIDRSSPVPYYHQLKLAIKREIVEKAMQPGDRLQGDLELCERFGVSRTVVRQALTELEFEGVIDRVKGSGTFVAQERTPQSLVHSLRGLYEDVAASGKTLRSKVLRLETVVPEPAIAEQMGLAPDEQVTVLERLRYIDEIPWVFVTTYLPAGTEELLHGADLEHGSLYALMDTVGMRPATGRRSVEVRIARGRLAKDLELKDGAPVLFLSSLGYNAAETPVELFHAYHRGDRSRFVTDLMHSSNLGGMFVVEPPADPAAR